MPGNVNDVLESQLCHWTNCLNKMTNQIRKHVRYEHAKHNSRCDGMIFIIILTIQMEKIFIAIFEVL